ncbi:uncharacterized protein H6S33_012793 [Morchella sextelata]|uniref:uncharacterized protein n=1 Tax=Morchella sextelata TaxID=1174677 RepID=UPI001D0446BF|nr:uncharacterized protein H6S33_012793 [Morchella sextelata]KAH0609307.1 hypothetical protein H6S33_012793 [Morchella sextelata]
MGQGSSAESDPSGAAAPETTVKTCYYELLGVARDATQDDIKKAYKKKALEFHPDRNYNDTERATRLFTEVQAAYEVISDPQERAWYDSHRDAILRNDDVGGGGGAGGAGGSGGVTNVTTTEDVMRWFSMFGRKLSYEPSHPQSFYVVVEQAFAKLAKEEVAAAEWEGLDPVHYPGFGGASSEYADWVKAFYVEWGNFRTAKTFSWCDMYRYSDAPDRRVKRMMEAENKKLRDAAIREFNDIVRSFVAFVRKRDPRYTPNNQTEKQRQEALLAASKEQAARQRAENAAKLRNYKAADWTNVPENAFDELYDSETDEDNTAEEYAEEQEDEEEEEEEEQLEEEPRRYECIVCKKIFAKEGPMLDHERSQKHARAVWELKKQMRKENKEFDLDRDVRGWTKPEEFKPIDEDEDEEYLSAEEEEDDLSADEEESKPKSKASPKEEESKKPLEPTPTTNTKPPTPSPAPSGAEDSDPDADADNDDYVSTATFTARLRGATTPPTSDLSNLTLTTNSDDEGSQKPAQKLGKAKAKKAKRAAAAAAAAAEEKGGKANTCAVCKQSFPSNTKMFNHLRDNPSHAVPVTGAGGAGTDAAGGGKKGKGKRRK